MSTILNLLFFVSVCQSDFASSADRRRFAGYLDLKVGDGPGRGSVRWRRSAVLGKTEISRCVFLLPIGISVRGCDLLRCDAERNAKSANLRPVIDRRFGVFVAKSSSDREFVAD
jgi:hypothetical protein